MTASRWGKLAIAALACALVASPAPSQTLGPTGEEFLKALKEGDRDTAFTLVRNDSGMTKYRGYSGDTGLHIVTRARDAAWMNFLLTNGADPDAVTKDGETALTMASRVGFSDGVATLLGRKAQVDKPNRRGETALIIAVQQRHTRVVKQLVERGANPDRRDFAAGLSAREYAKRDTRMPELLKTIEGTKKSGAAALFGPTR